MGEKCMTVLSSGGSCASGGSSGSCASAREVVVGIGSACLEFPSLSACLSAPSLSPSLLHYVHRERERERERERDRNGHTHTHTHTHTQINTQYMIYIYICSTYVIREGGSGEQGGCI